MGIFQGTLKKRIDQLPDDDASQLRRIITEMYGGVAPVSIFVNCDTSAGHEWKSAFQEVMFGGAVKPRCCFLFGSTCELGSLNIPLEFSRKKGLFWKKISSVFFQHFENYSAKMAAQGTNGLVMFFAFCSLFFVILL
jgi:hypothetical protein